MHELTVSALEHKPLQMFAQCYADVVEKRAQPVNPVIFHNVNESKDK